jgi:hypothetical protein
MRNFRQFLTEGTELPTIATSIKFSHPIDYETYGEIREDIENLDGVDNVDGGASLNSFTIYFNDISPSLYTRAGLTKYIDDFVNEVNNIIKWYKINDIALTARVFKTSLTFKGLPTSPIDFPLVIIQCQPDQTLSGIHKVVKCELLLITRCENVVGNVLSLMQINHRTEIDLQPQGNDPEWVLVVRDFLEPNERDIINCKEALIKNGYKEHAKL